MLPRGFVLSYSQRTQKTLLKLKSHNLTNFKFVADRELLETKRRIRKRTKDNQGITFFIEIKTKIIELKIPKLK